MEYRRLGRSGLNVSELSLGPMNFGNPTDEKEAFRIVGSALDSGINLMDCAGNYAQGKSEEILGRAFKRDGKRAKVLVTSKVLFPAGPGPNDRGNSRHHVIKACHASLESHPLSSAPGRWSSWKISCLPKISPWIKMIWISSIRWFPQAEPYLTTSIPPDG